MKHIGAHVSIGGGVENAPLNAQAIGATAFAMFTKSHRQWLAKPLTAQSIRAFRENCARAGYDPRYILPHDSYLINLCHPEKDGLEKSRQAFLDEFRRCEQLGLLYLNFHPGSHLNQMTESRSLALIAESINWTLAQTNRVAAVIENTAGQGSNVGFCFEHLAEIIERIGDKTRVGVCLDTCHTYSAGYDIKTASGYEQTLQAFDRIVGLNYLKGIHLNDSKKQPGSRVDRHEQIGQGTLGLETFRRIMRDSRLEHIPLILETPDDSLWPEEIRLLKSMTESDL
ncbi:MAG: deoxyribonuclease IV [Desulfobacteraceae bacterium]|nr:MAG: deoxyribonuclease IV [Desulfobacteraceae bacterium]